jgi:pheromone a factor receptor
VTKILLGSNVALPAACLCLLRDLDAIMSIREPTHSTPSKRNYRMFDATLCILLPIVYICLREFSVNFEMNCLVKNSTADFFVQDRRFDIVEDFGCQAAIYPSTIAIILMWFPPLFLCIIAFTYFGILSASSLTETQHSDRMIR